MSDRLALRLVPDELWELVEPLLPSFTPRPQGGGTAPVDERAVFTAVVYVRVCCVADAARELRAITGPVVEARARHDDLGKALHAAVAGWAVMANSITTVLHREGLTHQHGFDVGREDWMAATAAVRVPKGAWLKTATIDSKPQGKGNVHLIVVLAIAEVPNSPKVQLAAGISIAVAAMRPPLEVVWTRQEHGFVPSADTDTIMSMMVSDIDAQIPHAVDRLVELARTTS